MKAKQIESLESYIKTNNEHWNDFTFEILCEVIQQGLFENPETPLHLFSKAIEIFTEHHMSPLKATHLFIGEMDKHKLDTNQKLFVYEWVCKYLKNSEFDFEHNQILDLLESQKEKLITESQTIKPLTKNIRETLKDMIQKEVNELPNMLKELEPAQRLNILCKLIPFVLPKVESIEHTEGEPEREKGAFDWGKVL